VKLPGQKSGTAGAEVMRFRSADGEWVVELIRMSLTGDHRDGEHLAGARPVLIRC